MKPYLKSCDVKKGYIDKFPFKMRQKRVQFSYELATVFKQMKKYNHKTDGLMFTSESASYTLGTSQKMWVVFRPTDILGSNGSLPKRIQLTLESLLKERGLPPNSI